MSDDGVPPADTVAERQDRLVRSATDAYLAGDDEAAGAALDAWKTGEELRKAHRAGVRRLGPLVVTGTAAVLVLLAASLPVPGTLVTVDTVVGAATAELAAPYRWTGPVAVRAVVASGIDSLGWDGPPGSFQLTAAGPDVRLERLELGPAAHVEVDAPGDATDLHVGEGRVTAAISVRRGGVRTDDDSATLDLPTERPRAEITVSAGPTSAGHPFSLSLTDADSLVLDRLSVSRVRFVEDVAPGSAERRASIVTGRVELPAVERGFDLSAGSSLVLDLARPGLLSIRAVPGGFHLTLVGRVDRLAAGPDRYERSRMPRVLEYLAKSQTVALLWTAAVFLTGLAWSVWKWLV